MIVISDNCLIGPNVDIRSSTHKFKDKNNLIKNRGHTPRQAILQKDVWVDANSVMLPGVELSREVVVGAGSVVTESIPDHTLIAGVPAKIIQSRS